MREARPAYAVAAVALFVLFLFVQTLRLHVLIRHITESISETGKLVLVGFFFNSLLPGSVGGDAYKVLRLRGTEASLPRAMGLVAFDRLAGLIVIVAAGLAYLAYDGVPPELALDGEGSLDRYAAWFAFGLASLGLGAAVLFWRVGGSPAVRSYAQRLRQAAKSIRLRIVLEVFGLSVIVHGLRVARFWTCVACFGGEIALGGLLVAILLMPLGVLVPISVGGLGIQEGLIVLGLSLYGVPLPVGAAAALLNRFLLLGAAGAGALIYGVQSPQAGREESRR
jgi:uncharacterized membrane protein YbhN (UPF0104 family)